MSHRVEQRAGADGPVPLKQYGSLETRLARLRQLMYSNFLVPFNRGVSEARQHPKEDYEVSVREWNERYVYLTALDVRLLHGYKMLTCPIGRNRT